MARGDLSDGKWAVIGEIRPAERGGKAHPAHDNRRFLDGMLFVLAVPALLAMPVGKPRLMLAGKGCDGEEFRQSSLLKGVMRAIPPKANRRSSAVFDLRQYRDRSRIERMFDRLKAGSPRRPALRQNRHAFRAFLCLATSRIWLKDHVNRSQVQPGQKRFA
ncbi:hypothetical protein [Aureimonas sp. N4]|uniref:hypothetical protein n=1 Tax=Aureimonas sp. N4 TaxID=1638165 RepID=UPI000A5260C5|nr:hypothetical protein [Aureimonas sp. N4]